MKPIDHHEWTISSRIDWCDPRAACTKCSGTVGVLTKKHWWTIIVGREMVIITLQHQKYKTCSLKKIKNKATKMILITSYRLQKKF